MLLILIAIAAAVVGGYPFAFLIAATSVAMLYEWRRMTAGWGPAWTIGGYLYALIPALSLLWIRERGQDSLELLLWTLELLLWLRLLKLLLWLRLLKLHLWLLKLWLKLLRHILLGRETSLKLRLTWKLWLSKDIGSRERYIPLLG